MFENIRTITAVKLKEKYLINGRKKRINIKNRGWSSKSMVKLPNPNI